VEPHPKADPAVMGINQDTTLHLWCVTTAWNCTLCMQQTVTAWVGMPVQVSISPHPAPDSDVVLSGVCAFQLVIYKHLSQKIRL
jgi:hypothetical protein